METKFTKGPWLARVEDDEDSGAGAQVYEVYESATMHEHTLPILTLCNYRKDDVELLANAHLIAAAPELYDALQMAVNYMEDDIISLDMKILYAALAKARGES